METTAVTSGMLRSVVLYSPAESTGHEGMSEILTSLAQSSVKNNQK